MKIKAIIASTALLAAGFSTAHAVTTVAGDVLLGFRSTDSIAGNNNDLEVNLGGAQNFYNTSAAAGAVQTFSGLSVNDLSAVYGSWADNSTVVFGLAAAGKKTGTAVGGQVNGTIWLSKARVDQQAQSAAYGTFATSTQNSVIDVIGKYQGLSGFTGNPVAFSKLTATANSTTAAIADGAQGGSYKAAAAGNAAFFSLSGTTNSVSEKDTTASLGTIGNAWALTDFYILNPVAGGTAIYAGTFGLALANTTLADGSIRNAGSLVYEFNSASQFTAIPEPSTYAAILGALTVGFVALRRRFSKAV